MFALFPVILGLSGRAFPSVATASGDSVQPTEVLLLQTDLLVQHHSDATEKDVETDLLVQHHGDAAEKDFVASLATDARNETVSVAVNQYQEEGDQSGRMNSHQSGPTAYIQQRSSVHTTATVPNVGPPERPVSIDASTRDEEMYKYAFTVVAWVLLVGFALWANGPLQPGDGRMYAMDGSRGIVQICVVVYHIAVKDIFFQSWGTRILGGLPLVFAQMGFFSGVLLPPKMAEPRFSDAGFVILRMIRLYPCYWVACGWAMLTLYTTGSREELAGHPYIPITFAGFQGMLGASWTPWAMDNPINTPGWFVGVLIYLAALTPALVRMILHASMRTRLYTLLPVTYMFTILAAWENAGHALSPMRTFNAMFLWSAHVPEYFFGLVLGVCFLERDHPDMPSLSAYNWTGNLIASVLKYSGSIVMFSPIWACTPFWCFDQRSADTVFRSFFISWNSQGLFLPTLIAGFWQLAKHESWDLVAHFLASRPMVTLGTIGFNIFLFQQVVFVVLDRCSYPACVTAVLPPAYLADQSSVWFVQMYFWLLCFIACVIHHAFEKPVGNYLSRLLIAGARSARAEGGDANAGAAKGAPEGSTVKTASQNTPAKESSGLAWLPRLLLYYGLLLAVIRVFYSCSVNRGVPAGWDKDSFIPNPFPRESEALLYALLGVSVPFVVANFLGHLRYPTILRNTDAKGHSAQLPFRVRFQWSARAVSGASTLTDAMSEAHTVLESMQLAPESYALEVVTDEFIHCPVLSELPATQIIMPREAYGSTEEDSLDLSATDSHEGPVPDENLEGATNRAEADDWIVKLGAGAKLNSKAVGEILVYVMAEHQAVAAGTAKYGRIGYGSLLFGGGQDAEKNDLVSSMCDSVRVGEEHGIWHNKNSLFANFSASYLVINKRVQELDAKDRYRISCCSIDGSMCAPSASSCASFFEEREAWYCGIVDTFRNQKAPLMDRFWLGLFFVSRLYALFCFAGYAVLMQVAGLPRSQAWYLLCLLNACTMWTYVCGFIHKFDPTHGLVRYYILAVVQTLGAPFYSAIELLAAWRAIIHRGFLRTSSK